MWKVPATRPIPIIRKTVHSTTNRIPRVQEKSGPTDDTLRQCGHLARALVNVLNKNVSLQCAQEILHIPGDEGIDDCTGLGVKLIILLQLGRGQAILCDDALQMSKQLHGQRTYFFPAGALLIGVASLHSEHLTTC